MATKPTLNLPEWASSEAIGTNVVEPVTRKTTGYTATSGVPEKPTYQEINFLFKSIYEWLEYLEIATDESKEYTITCGEDLSAGDIVRISGGQAFKADNTTEAGITAVAGVNVNAVTSGNNATIAYGFYDAFTALTVGTTYYVGVGGGITNTLPATYQVELGVAVSTTRINLDVKSKYQARNLEIENSNPNINLKDTNGGTSETQSINFETIDGNYAKIEGATTGNGVGELNLYTNSGSGITKRITVGESTKINQYLYIHDHSKYVLSSTTNVLQLQSASGGFHSWFIEVFATSTGITRGAMRTYSIRSYSGSVNAIETMEIYTPTNGMSINLVNSGGGVLTIQATNSSIVTCKFILKIYTQVLINVTKL
jgi:hypothetical protein